MDADAFKNLLERQARERADLEQTLEQTRPERAWQAARSEQDQPTPPHPSWAKPARPPLKAIVERHEHNLRIQDEHQLAALDQRHAAERPPSPVFNQQAGKKLDFYEASVSPSPDHQVKR